MNKDNKLIFEAYMNEADGLGISTVGQLTEHLDTHFEDHEPIQFMINDRLVRLAHIEHEGLGEGTVQFIFQEDVNEDDSSEELQRVDPRGYEFEQALEHFKSLISAGKHQEARNMTERFAVDFTTDWENAKPELAEWLVLDAGLDGASVSELLDLEVNDHGDILGPSRW